ncbi:hypothetical protein Anas_08050, partial [Armadillidium nasatum]
MHAGCHSVLRHHHRNPYEHIGKESKTKPSSKTEAKGDNGSPQPSGREYNGRKSPSQKLPENLFANHAFQKFYCKIWTF